MIRPSNETSLIVSIILKKNKLYFDGICAFSKREAVNFTRSFHAFVQKA